MEYKILKEEEIPAFLILDNLINKANTNFDKVIKITLNKEESVTQIRDKLRRRLYPKRVMIIKKNVIYIRKEVIDRRPKNET